MARVIACEEEGRIELAELVAALNEESFDPGDEESFAAMAPLVRSTLSRSDGQKLARMKNFSEARWSIRTCEL